MTYWLLVERLENWEVDRMEGFRRFGLPEKKKRWADEMKTGDKLIFYVSSGMSRFADVREVIKEGTFRLGASGAYDTAFPLFIATKPILTLDIEKWVAIQNLTRKLSFTAGMKDWRQVMRTSMRRLNHEDVAVILDAMNRSANAVIIR